MIAASTELAKACWITERSLALMKENPEVVDDAVLLRYPEYG